jgi:hypothetical protein
VCAYTRAHISYGSKFETQKRTRLYVLGVCKTYIEIAT